MAVLVEGISVLVRKDAIQKKMRGGEARFKLSIPNATFCEDSELTRVGFLNPADVETYIEGLIDEGLVFIEEGKCIDIVVCDQQRGPTSDCDWLEFCHIPMENGKVRAAWLYEDERIAGGVHMRDSKIDLSTPSGWKFKDSLSDKFQFVPNDSTIQ